MNSNDDSTVGSGLPASEPLKAGDSVVINGEKMKVLSVDETGNPNLARVTERPPVSIDMAAVEERVFAQMTEDALTEQHSRPELVDFENMNKRAKMKLDTKALELWNNLVTGIIRKAKGLKPEEAVELPNGGEGRYIAYALDSQGRFSAGKGHGRRKVRFKSHQADMERLKGQLFGIYLTSAFKAAQATAKEGEQAEPITAEVVHKGQRWIQRKAEQIMAAPKKRAAKAARKRQQASRRINAGVTPGNSDRRAHASA